MCGGDGVGAWSGDVSIHCVISFFLVLEFMQVCVFVYRYS